MALSHFVDGVELTASALNALLTAARVTTVPAFVVGEHPASKLNLLRAAAGLTQFIPPFVDGAFFSAANLNLLVDAINLLTGQQGAGQAYVLPIASTTVLGGIRIGTGLITNPADGTTSVIPGSGGGGTGSTTYEPTDADNTILVDADGNTLVWPI